MTKDSERLMRLAEEYRDELSRHEVLKPLWKDLSLVLKGSTARGRADRLSDVDFVFYTDPATFRAVVDGYRALGLSKREDGVFVPLPDWIGHYHFEVYPVLEGYFRDKNMPQAWECVNVAILHDPAGTYRRIVDEGMRGLFDRHLDLVREKYLKLQLTLDWGTHPLQRGDRAAAMLHAAGFVRTACELCYLLGKRPYPHDKWLYQHLDEDGIGAGVKRLISDYMAVMDFRDLPVNLELDAYPQFTVAIPIVESLKNTIRRLNGDQPWLEEWYLYV